MLTFRTSLRFWAIKRRLNPLDVPDSVGTYFWVDLEDYRSYVGVELNVYRRRRGKITVDTRSRFGRSYWDLAHQNKTLKLIRDLFGGHFTTDAGRNRYLRPKEPPPTPMASGCFLARWRFHNDLGRARIYLTSRKFEGASMKKKPPDLQFLDNFNPHLLSNNLLLPYLVAVWEEFFRATFAALFKYTSKKDRPLKRARLDPADLEDVAAGTQSIERAVAESLNFQRPSSIAENFRLLDRHLDIAAALRKPYRRRKTKLFDSIEELIEIRNEFVHTGRMSFDMFDEQLNGALNDLEVAANRVYEHVAKHYKFLPSATETETENEFIEAMKRDRGRAVGGLKRTHAVVASAADAGINQA